MKKRWISLLLSFVMMTMLMPQLPVKAMAATTGTCGDQLTWVLDDDGTLTISGTGDMHTYGLRDTPWDHLRSSIKRLQIEDGVATIGSFAFYDCSKLTSVTISDSVTSINYSAFSNCTNLANVEIGRSVTNIGSSAFSSCIRLTSVTIPNSVTTINDSAFSNCTNLANVTLGDSVTIIDRFAFEECISLTSVTIPGSVSSIGNAAFFHCSSLTNVTIPNGVTTIGASAFSCCTSLTSVTIPGSVTSLGDSAFGSCTNLTEIHVDSNNPNYSSDEYGVLFDKNKTVLLQAPGAISGSYSIPESVTVIRESAFSGCSSLVDVTIGNNITIINPHTFYFCVNLNNVTIGSNATSIGAYAFSNCRNLSSITIPEAVTDIGTFAFAYCNALNEIKFRSDTPSIGTNAFSRVTATAYYPADNPTWTSDVMQNYGGTITWVPYTPEPEELPDLPEPDGPQLIDGFAFSEDTYVFSNADASPFLIPKEYFTTLFKEDVGKLLYKQYKYMGQGGVCVGMAYTTAAIFNGFPAVSSFVNDGLFSDEYCFTISDLTKKSKTIIGAYQITLHGYIKYAHIYQLSTNVQDQLTRTMDDLDGLRHAVEQSLESDWMGVTIAIIPYAIDPLTGNRIYGSHHRVLAVGMEGNDILIVDSNFVYNSDRPELRRLTINPDGSWSYNGSWTSDTISSNNNYAIAYATDVAAPFNYLATGTHATPAAANMIYPMTDDGEGDDVFVEGMDRVDSDKMLCAIRGEGYEIANTDITEISTFLPTDSGSHVYWISSDPTLSVDRLPAHSEIALAGSDSLMTVTTEAGGSIDMTKDGRIVLDTAAGSDCTISVDTTGTDGQDIILTISGSASSETVTLNQTNSGITISGISNGTITLVENDEMIEQEQMPAEENEVHIDYDPDGGNDDIKVGAACPFTDVPVGAFYEAPVLWAVENGITTGATADTFNPNGQCLRAQVVTFLHRAAGNPAPGNANNPFTDVKTSDFFYAPVLWAVEKGITNGTGAATFGSYDVCNRAAVVTFLWRAAGSPEPESTDNPFTDVESSDFFYKPVLWAIENGITNGVDATHFGPTSPCNRAQVVTFLYRTYN